MQFRWPRLESDQIDRLYRLSAANTWSEDAEESPRQDWAIIKDYLSRQGSHRTILDVGCSAGGFLNYLGDQWERYGIELSQSAANSARNKGVKIIGDDVTKVEKLAKSFPVVTAMDVIEHVFDPLAFLGRLAQITRDGGTLIISTGNTASRSWRLMKNRYWYCTNPEHVSFINPAWCSNVSKSLGLTIEAVLPFSHSRRTVRKVIKDVAANSLYRCAPSVCKYARLKGYGGINTATFSELAGHPPGWMTAKDHFVVVFKRS
jgi:2-polyprenyl-3-methyl-5-hydroxy-6-metoxy-1,4-benzoquinol methylase